MLPYVLGVTGASAQPLAERALQLLLQRERTIHLVLSRGAHEVFRAEQGLSIPVEPQKQEEFWREHLKVSTGELICHRWKDQSAAIASDAARPARCSCASPSGAPRQ